MEHRDADPQGLHLRYLTTCLMKITYAAYRQLVTKVNAAIKSCLVFIQKNSSLKKIIIIKKPPLEFINLSGYVKSWGDVTFDENAISWVLRMVRGSLLLSPKVASVDLTTLLFFL